MKLKEMEKPVIAAGDQLSEHLKKLEHSEKVVTEENSTIISKLENEIKEFTKVDHKFDVLTLTYRPKGMSWELYKFLRKVNNRTLKNYLKR